MFHGGIGNVDIESILIKQGFTPLEFPFTYRLTWKAAPSRILFALKWLFKIPAGSIIVFQFPVYARMQTWLLQMLCFRKSIRIVCLIADIDGLKDGDEQLLQKEKKALRRFQYFIVHNNAMRRWLDGTVPGNQSSSLEFFDFLATPFSGIRTKSTRVVFAGNLTKSPFIEKLQPIVEGTDLVFHIYGPNPGQQVPWNAQIVYKGVHEPYALPQLLEGSFGLVWDGRGVDGPEGSLGHYMEYITHHKVSLYILSGLPLIVYEKAGSAELVRKYKIGITISSLHDIYSRLQSLPEADYREMCENTRSLAAGIAKGNGLLQALQDLSSRMPH